MVFPSLVIILVIASVLSNFADIPAVQSAFAGIRVCVCVLIFNAIIKLWKSVVKDRYSLVCVLAVFLLATFLDISPVIFVLLGAVCGIIIKTAEVRSK
jgi:chromate transporter